MSIKRLEAQSFKEKNEYRNLFERISTLIEYGRKTAVRQIHACLTVTYWLMGHRIVEYEQKGHERAGYGDAVLKTLAEDLTRRFGKGFGYANLNLMRQFYLTYPPQKILQTPSGESVKQDAVHRFGDLATRMRELSIRLPLPWSHYCLLIRMEEPEKRDFYHEMCLLGHWSIRQLTREIQTMLYERTTLSKRKQIVLKKANENPIILRLEDEIKDSYVLDFLGLKDEYSESQLEDALIRHLENFLLELGVGFTFVARQKRFMVDGDNFRIDLMLYHRGLRALALIDLKVGAFHYADSGQMNFYLNWAKDHAKLPGENDPFGIILCADTRKTYAKYAVGGLSNKIFVAKYKLQLPDPCELQKELERGRDLFLQRQIFRPALLRNGVE